MQFTVLVNNSSSNETLEEEHGLSIYAQCDSCNLLFDSGQTSMFERNASKLGIDLSMTDMAVLSHGHYDHAGGFNDFLKQYPHKTIALSRSAWIERFSVKENLTKSIGISLPQNGNYIFVDGEISTFQGVTLFTLPFDAKVNKRLLKYSSCHKLVPDTFDDEVFTIIRTDDKTVLFGGCTHHGIVNLLNYVFDHFQLSKLDAFIGGLHLSACTEQQIADEINGVRHFKIDNWMLNHCSGDCAIDAWKREFGERVVDGRSGCILTI